MLDGKDFALMALEEIGEYSWTDEANCLGIDSKVFKVKDKFASEIAMAKIFCSTCVVRRDCLETALTIDDRDQILGGLTPQEREGIYVGLFLRVALGEGG